MTGQAVACDPNCPGDWCVRCDLPDDEQMDASNREAHRKRDERD